MPYAKVDDRILHELIEIAGAANVITDPETLENYAHDETPLYKAMPEAVVRPDTTDQVARIMLLAHENNIPVTPRGGGTCLSAGAVPIHGGIVLSLERMNKIVEIDEDNMMVTTQPGIVTEQLGKELAKHGLFFPPDPVSLDSCTIGGNIAECAGGPRAMKYGVTRNYVTGITAVLADGTVLKMGGKLLKNATGYDLINLITGSEGTLAIVTEATIRVLPLPKVIVDLLVPFACVEEATDFAVEVMQTGLMPASIEFMEGDVVHMVSKYLARQIPYMDANAHTIVEIDGDDKKTVRKTYDRIGEIALKHGALDILVAEGTRDKERMWEPRKKVGDTLKELTKNVAREDLVVPKKQIPQLISRLKECVGKYDATVYTFGHLGDGNIHADVSIDKTRNMDAAHIDRMRREIYEITLSLGGAITAEHGVGLSKIPYLAMALDEKQIALMKKIKQAFDPKNVLNPGKVLPVGKADKAIPPHSSAGR
ncbi:FAD-binding oxidoreductase [candidate division WOR-3 bacterium]|nr:FAD-binding oxidoreductase [candidate division WOR-3 bacterium]